MPSAASLAAAQAVAAFVTPAPSQAAILAAAEALDGPLPLGAVQQASDNMATRVANMIALFLTEADGGPAGDGQVNIRAVDGGTVSVPSWRKAVATVEQNTLDLAGKADGQATAAALALKLNAADLIEAMANGVEAATVADGTASVDAFVVTGGVTKRATLGAFMVGLLGSTSAQAMRLAAGLGASKTPQDHGAKCDGTTNDATALSAASSAGLPILHRSGVLRIATAMTMAAPIYPDPGALILVDGVTLTLGGGFNAAGVRAFTCVNGGKVVFADSFVGEIDVRWWGFAQGAAAAVNDAAIAAARDSITTRGIVRFPAGAFAVSAYTPINRSYIKFVGASSFGTTLVPTAGAGDVTGIDGYAQPGFVLNTSPYLDETAHLNISVLRQDSQSATVTLDGERYPTAIPSGPKGFILRYAANATVSFQGDNSPIDYYENQTTGCRVDVTAKRAALGGDTAATLRFGVVSDCLTTAGTSSQISSNGSSYKRLKNYTQPAFAGESWSCLVYGSDLRDHFWESFESGNDAHALDYICTGSNEEAWDIHFTRAVCDGWVKSGIRLKGLPAGSKANFVDGYTAAGATASGAVTAFDVNACAGVILGEGFEVKGGSDYANAQGVMLRNSSSRCRIGGTVTGCKDPVTVSGGAFNTISSTVEALGGQPVEAAIRLINGTSRNTVSGYQISDDTGTQTIAVGVLVDAASSYNLIDSGMFASIGGIGTNIQISGSAITTAGTYNHNVVTAGAIGT